MKGEAKEAIVAEIMRRHAVAKARERADAPKEAPKRERATGFATEPSIADANWVRSGHDSPQWRGQCQRCGRIKDAVELEVKKRPFGKGEWWRCQGHCW